MDKWVIKQKVDVLPSMKNPILLEGLPGIGNVGKIAVDFLLEELGATAIYEIYSTTFPHSVFVNEDNLIELPCIHIHHIKLASSRDLLILSGDIQPMGEKDSYEFCTQILDLASKFSCKEVITLGGIGLASEPESPNVYGVATSKEAKARYQAMDTSVKFKDCKAASIVGATGLLVGLAALRGWSGLALLTETFGHNFHLGLKESKETLKVLKKYLNLDIDISIVEREIKKEERNKIKEGQDEERALLKKLRRMGGETGDTGYIG